MQTRYNVHRAATTQSRAIHGKYKGQVDFKGGAYGILKGAVARQLELDECVEERSAGGGAHEEGGGTELHRRQCAVELTERENKAREHAVQIMQRENKAREHAQALKAKSGGALIR